MVQYQFLLFLKEKAYVFKKKSLRVIVAFLKIVLRTGPYRLFRSGYIPPKEVTSKPGFTVEVCNTGHIIMFKVILKLFSATFLPFFCRKGDTNNSTSHIRSNLHGSDMRSRYITTAK